MLIEHVITQKKKYIRNWNNPNLHYINTQHLLKRHFDGKRVVYISVILVWYLLLYKDNTVLLLADVIASNKAFCLSDSSLCARHKKDKKPGHLICDHKNGKTSYLIPLKSTQSLLSYHTMSMCVPMLCANSSQIKVYLQCVNWVVAILPVF